MKDKDKYWKHNQEWYDLTIDSYNLDELQKFIIKSNKHYLAYFFALNVSKNNHLMQKIVLDSKDPYYCVLFAQHIPNADIKAFQQIVINSGKYEHITDFACFVPKSDKKKLINIITKYDNKFTSKYVYKLIKNLNIDIDKLKHYIFNNPKPTYLYHLALKLTKKKDISKIEKLLLESKSLQYIKMFAENIKLANIDNIEKFVLKNFDSKSIKNFAKYVKRSKLKAFTILG